MPRSGKAVEPHSAPGRPRDGVGVSPGKEAAAWVGVGWATDVAFGKGTLLAGGRDVGETGISVGDAWVSVGASGDGAWVGESVGHTVGVVVSTRKA